MNVSPSYRLGISIVVGTVLASLAVLSLAGVGRAPAASDAPPAGQNLGSHGFPLGAFRLTERSGRAVTDADLSDRVWVAAFVFTHCPLSCPRITSVMKGLQAKFEGTGVRLVSVSVDPARDTPEVLAAYADRFGADRDRWWFLTGPPDGVRALITGGFKLGVRTPEPDEVKAGAEEVLHSEKLALVDGNTVVGYFDSNDRAAVTNLVDEARRLDRNHTVPAWARRLPAVNAGLNGSCAVLLAVAWVLIRAGRYRAHAALMVAAVAVSALFLACYLVYHFYAGSVAFRGTGAVRLTYLTILLSHTLLATFGVVPLVALTVWRAARRRFVAHATVARLTFPIWVYVSVTGVIIYWMLYQLPIGPPAASL